MPSAACPASRRWRRFEPPARLVRAATAHAADAVAGGRAAILGFAAARSAAVAGEYPSWHFLVVLPRLARAGLRRRPSADGSQQEGAGGLCSDPVAANRQS